MHDHTSSISLPNNASSRCRSILLKLSHRPSDLFGDSFAYALGIDGYSSANPDHKDLVRVGMSELRKQIISIINDLERMNYIAPELYAAMYGAKDTLGTIDRLDGAPAHYPQLIEEKVALTFGWAACILEIDNEEIDYDLVSEILSDLMALRAKMNSTTLPIETRILFKRLIDSLERAAIEANFIGIQSINRALREAQNDAVEAKEKIVEENKNMSEEHRDFLASASGVFEKFGKITSNAKEIVAIVAPAVTGLLG